MKRLTTFTLFIVFTLSVNAQRFDVDTISKTGNLEDRINLVFLPDGYQQNEMDKFIEDVHWMLDAILKKAPYNQYTAYFNAFAVRVPSAVSGAANDPDSLINNYFGSTFNWANIWRLVVPAHSGKVYTVLQNNFPQYDQVFMIVNDSRYGGSGGWIATSTTHVNGPEICIHEMGHSFAGLSDEYWAGSQYARENINMTQNNNTETVTWKNWLGTGSVGIYSHTESPTWYRPHQNCEMRYLDRQFCRVCQEAIASKILDLTSPVVSFYPEEDQFVNTEPYLDFKLSLLKPSPNTLKITWKLNRDSIAANTDSIRFAATQLQAGENEIVAMILDTTQYIRKSSHSQVHLNQIKWTFDAGTSSIDAIDRESFHLDIYPNPASDYVSLQYSLTETTELQILLISSNGEQLIQKVYPGKPAGQYQEVIDLKSLHLAAGHYYIQVYLNNDRFTLPLIVQ